MKIHGTATGGALSKKDFGVAFNSSGGGFDPDSIDGLGVWYDASDNSTITESSNRVSQWDDKKGSADLSQSTSGDQPLLVEEDQNGLDVIDFDGDRFMSVSGGEVSQPQTFYIALTGFANTGTLKRPIWAGNQQIFTSNTTANKWVMYAGLEPNFTEDIGTGFQIWRIVFNGASSYWYVNGNIKIDAGNAGTKTTGGAAVGAASDGGAPSNNKFGEILRYDALVSSDDNDEIMTYLNDKWGL